MADRVKNQHNEQALIFSERLSDRMDILKMSRTELANKADISVSTLDSYLYMRIQPGAFTLLRIANALRCSVDWLLGVDVKR